MSYDLEHVMERIGRILTADSTLHVEVRGDACYAKPGAVVLPALERYEYLGTDQAERLLFGLADHEIGHVADSDFRVIEAARKRKERRAFTYLINVIEDGYVEGRRGRLYPGSRYNLRKKNEWFWTVDFPDGTPSCATRIADRDRPAWERFLLALAMWVRPDGPPHRIEEIEALDAGIANMIRHVERHTAEIPELWAESQQSAECERIARAIWADLEPPDEDEEDEEPPKKPGEGDDQVEIEFGEGPGSTADTRPLDQEMNLEIRRFEEEEGGRPLNPEEAIQFRVRKVFEQPAATRPYVIFDPSFDIERDFSGEWTDQLSSRYEELRKETAAVTDDLVHTFEAALRDREMRRLSFDGDEEGEIDPSLLPGFSLGAIPPESLWIDYHAESEGGHAAVAILLDCSGSMGNGVKRDIETDDLGNPVRGADGKSRVVETPSASHLARMCAIASHEALKRTGVPHEVTGFTTIDSDHVGIHPWAPGRVAQYEAHFEELRKLGEEARKHGTDLAKFARTWPDWGGVSGFMRLPFYGVFKGFGSAEPRGLVLVAGVSQNLDGEAILWQARRLARRPERRKLMIVLSDGYPAGSRDNAQGARYLSESVGRAINAGIEVYGIGIQSRAVEEFYPHWWLCQKLEDLPSIMLRALIETVVDTGGG